MKKIRAVPLHCEWRPQGKTVEKLMYDVNTKERALPLLQWRETEAFVRQRNDEALMSRHRVVTEHDLGDGIDET